VFLLQPSCHVYPQYDNISQWNTFINIIFLIVISLLYIMRSRHLSDNIHQESFSMMYNPINQLVVASILFAIMKDMKIIGDKTAGLIIDG
jgi:hypothetical protein